MDQKLDQPKTYRCGRCPLYDMNMEREQPKYRGRCRFFDAVSTFKRKNECAVVRYSRRCRYGFKVGYDFSHLTATEAARIANARHKFFLEKIVESDINIKDLVPDF